MAIPGLRRIFRLAAGRSTARADAAEELRLHLELRAEELIAEGMAPEAARAEALRRFGDPAAIQRSLHKIDRGAEYATRRAERLDSLLGDLRQTLRGLRRNPGFAVGTVLTLGLGIGLNTGIFSVYDGVILRPFPFAEPDRVVRVWSNKLDRGMRFFSVSLPDFNDWKAANRSFAGLAAYERQQNWTLTGGDGADPEQIEGARVSAAVFALLGATPVLGRTFFAQEDLPGAPGRPVILSYGFWQRHFGASHEAVGSVLTLNGEPATVIGVMPRRFILPGNPAELWFPLGAAVDNQARGRRFLRVLGRLRPGVSLDDARQELGLVSRRLEAQYPETNSGWSVTVLGLTDAMIGERFHSAVRVLLGAVGLVLLIVCANVATMVLGRNVARSRELAVRAALGAGKARLGRLLLTEGIVLGVIGGGIGVALAFGMVRLLRVLDPQTLPRLNEVGLNGTVLGVAALLALGCGIAVGLVPLARATRPALTDALRESGRGVAGGRRRQRTQRMLVVAQMSLAILLLSGAGLLIRSLLQLQAVELGFDPNQVLAVDLTLPAAKYGDRTLATDFYERLLERVRSLPGVAEAAAASSIPLTGNNAVTVFAIEGRPAPDPKSVPDVDVRSVTPGYFHLMAIPLLRGRDFTQRDDSAAAPVVIISATTARKYWPEQDALGQRIRIGNLVQGPLVEVVGIVGDVRHLNLESPEHRPLLYYPLRATGDRSMSVLVRTAGDPAALSAGIRKELRALDPLQPVALSRTLEEVVDAVYAPQRFNVVVLGSFALAALLLAAIGLYGVMAYAVRQRTRELGVRLALGADRGAVVRMILGEALGLVAVGIGLGLGGALVLDRTLTALLFGVKPGDPLALVLASVLLLSVALLGSYAPARRAARVDPMETLRAE
ncbi:MAG TPA: ABC transporter permease [Gemmatimonadales bacterium]|jgi:predicted permease|nr:ABC transporter permease [Gemmatimonadales bacterium]